MWRREVLTRGIGGGRGSRGRMGLDGNVDALGDDLSRADGTPDGVEGNVDGGHGVGGRAVGERDGRSPAGLITQLSFRTPRGQLVYYLFSAQNSFPSMFQRSDSDLAFPIRHPRLIGRIDTDPIPSLFPGQ